MKIIQVVGFKNSGKTTLVSELIRRFTKAGYRVGSLKHHGHGGTPELPPQKDSDLHLHAGSVASGVEGEGQFTFTMKRPNWTLDALIQQYENLDLDILFIEGFKHASYKKLVLLRNEADQSLLDELDNIIGVIAPFTVPHLPTFNRNQVDRLFGWLLNLINYHFMGLVIAGGKSSRYGKPKAFEAIGEQYFYEKSLHVLKIFCDRTGVITNDQLKNQFDTDVPILVDVDIFQNQGPLAGLYTGMKRFDSDWYATLPVDVPYITPKVFMHLVKEISPGDQAIVPVTDDQKQPLIALYHKSVVDTVETLLKDRRQSFHHLLDNINTVYIEMEDSDAFLNVNYPTDHPGI